jgi:hypothetical protein
VTGGDRPEDLDVDGKIILQRILENQGGTYWEIEVKAAHIPIVRRPEGRRPFGRPRCRWEDNISVELREIRCESVEWTHLAKDRNQWRSLVNRAMNLQVTQKAGKFLTS